MIWDVLNALVQVLVGFFHYAMTLLPPSPIYLSSADVAAVAGVATYAAFWLPVTAIAVTLAVFVAGLVVWVTVLLLIQLVEAVTP